MRRRIKDYSISLSKGELYPALTVDFGIDMTGYTNQQFIDSIRLVIDETTGLVLASSLKKNTITGRTILRPFTTKCVIQFDFSNCSVKDYEKVQKIQTTDSFTIEVDTGEVPMEVSAITDTFINALT
jgi:hypothetical protein